MTTLIAKNNQLQSGQVILTGEDAHHLKKVLRIRAGETVKLTNNVDQLFEGKIKTVDNSILIEVTQTLDPIPVYPITVFVSWLKGDKMEILIQKLSELNIQSLHFIKTQNSIPRQISLSKWQRFLKIALEAQKQCGRMVTLELQNWDNGLSSYQPDSDLTHFFCLERNHPPPLTQLIPQQNPKGFGLWIGPEGAFSDEEVDWAQQNNFVFAGLGPIILKSDTAALKAVSTLCTHL